MAEKLREPLVIVGKPALSTFGLSKLQKHQPAICFAQYIHVLDLSGDLSNAEMIRVKALLEYGPNQELPEHSGQLLATVLPRRGTTSPWSSKATDIFRTSGLDKVLRVERGIRWFVDKGTKAAQFDLTLIHDRMTEEVIFDDNFSEVFLDQKPEPLRTIELGGDGIAALQTANAQLGLALSADEIDYLVDAYGQLRRDPTDVELMMFAQANSEHCRHKIFNADWLIDDMPQSNSLFGMIRNTHKRINGRGVLSAYSDNAAVIEGNADERLWIDGENHGYNYVQEPIHVLMKVETHNHPTAIAPFPGAATGSGGEIRDEGAVGRGSKPKAGLTGFSTSHLNLPEMPQPWELTTGKPEHTASALDIMLEGPIGGASFNNEFGRPAICGYFRTFEIEHFEQIRGYHKPVMIAGGVGTVREEHVLHRDFEVGTALVILGGPAMLIGLGGSAASSIAAGSGATDLDFASVQRGNPEMERRCQEVIDACCAMGADNPIQLIHDVGAGGMSNALPELVSDANSGGDFKLRAIPNADPGMSPLEIWCNEAQERYVMGIAQDKLAAFEALCERERCPYAVVGNSTAEKHLHVSDEHFDNAPVDIPLDVLLGKVPKMQRSFSRQQLPSTDLDLAEVKLDEAIKRVLEFPAVASKQFLITIGDRSITGMVANQQMIGPWQVPVADVAVTIRGYKTYRGEAFAMGERSPVALINPQAAARLAVAESLTNIISADIESVDRVVLSANWMAASGANAEEQSLFDAVYAVGEEFCPALGIAIPVGKDSLSMQTRWQDTDTQVNKAVVSPVTLIVSSFAPVSDVRLTLTPEIRLQEGSSSQDSSLVLLHFGAQRLGGSVLGQVYNQIGSIAPDVDDPALFRATLDFLIKQNRSGSLLACHDRSDGGVLTTLLEMSFAGRCGLIIDIPQQENDFEWLFNEELGFVVQVADAILDDFLKQVPCLATVVAKAQPQEDIIIRQNGDDLYISTRAELQQTWAQTSYLMQRKRDNEECAAEEFASILPRRDQSVGLSADLGFDVQEDITAKLKSISINTQQQPRVAILREQGVNGQIEMAAAFERSGFAPYDVHMTDLIEGRQRLADFQTVVACGGFSYGDVLGGGGGWAKSILFNNALRDQFEAYFAHGLVLGICNGCQMLAQLAELIPGADHWPKFVRNKSEQFEGRTVMVRINEISSAWLDGMQGSVMPVAVAHGEGRAEFTQHDDLNAMLQGNSPAEVALQYVDDQHQITQTYPHNPNGAIAGLAGVTANSGRVLAMMPHPERVYRGCQNVWVDPTWGEDGPWLRLFRNARVALN